MASVTREIVTVQVGHFANFIGTHWWNLQESSFVYSPVDVTEPKEIDHDVLFREGQNLLGDITYTPRLISVDLKGSLNTLKQDGSLYDISGHDDVQWDSDVTLHKLDLANKNDFLRDLEDTEAEISEASNEERESDFDESAVNLDVGSIKKLPPRKIYQLDDSISVWSDFLRPHLHPKSVHLLKEYQHNNDLQRFDVYGYGRQAMATEWERNEIEDRVHYFLEECDHLQGMHLLVDTYDGFAGLGTSLIEQVQDDYVTKGFTIFGVAPPSFIKDGAQEQVTRILNSVMSYDTLCSTGSAFIPLTTNNSMWTSNCGSVEFPHLTYKPGLWYHSSAILGSCIDTATLPYRLAVQPSFMTHLTDALTAGGRKMLGMQMSLPFPMKNTDTLVDSLMAIEGLPWKQVTPSFNSTTHPYAQSVVLRGIKNDNLKGKINEGMPGEIRSAVTGEDILDIFLRDHCPNTLSAACVLQQSIKTSAPYPHLFNSKINESGFIDSTDRKTLSDVDHIPAMTSLQASISSIDHINNLLSLSSNLKIKKYNRFLESGIEEDEFNECRNNLETFTQSYQPNVEAMY